MKKLSLCVVAIILTHFVLKTLRKLKHTERFSEEETYRVVHDAHKQWLKEHNWLQEQYYKQLHRDYQPQRPVPKVDALSSIAEANLNLMNTIEKERHCDTRAKK